MKKDKKDKGTAFLILAVVFVCILIFSYFHFIAPFLERWINTMPSFLGKSPN
jgi:phosphotransferase system  glucose/maltose/N-acetylglucosamine-specific IIC component